MKILRGAVIGYGFISSLGHLPAYLRRRADQGDVEITAIADICAGRRSLAADRLAGVRVYSNHRELLQAEAAELDFIDIATPPCDHAAIAHAAFDAGLHVLCEKPLTTSLDQARSLLAHAQQSRRVIFPCHNYKHAPVVKTIRDIIHSGQIGAVRSLTLNTYRDTHAKGVPEWNSDWRRQSKFSGGGIAMDHGSHTFYLTFDWLGGYPTAVTAHMSTLHPDLHDTEDNFSAVLTFPHGLAHVHLTWTAGVRKVIYTVQGEHGAITVDDDDLQLAVKTNVSGPARTETAARWNVEKRCIASQWMDASHVEWFNSLFDRFKDAIEREDYLSQEAREACLCVQLIQAAYTSASQNCRQVAVAGSIPV